MKPIAGNPDCTKYPRAVHAADRPAIAAFLHERWGDTLVVSRGKAHDASQLEGLIAYDGSQIIGLLLYSQQGDELEVVTLDSIRKGSGLGSILLQQVQQLAHERGLHYVRLITSNDNLDALRFYQRRGFRLSAIFPDAITKARTLKPTIPLIGFHEIPIRDELELELRVD